MPRFRERVSCWFKCKKGEQSIGPGDQDDPGDQPVLDDRQDDGDDTDDQDDQKRMSQLVRMAGWAG